VAQLLPREVFASLCSAFASRCLVTRFQVEHFITFTAEYNAKGKEFAAFFEREVSGSIH
jgi:hypothetical protein